MWYFAVMGTEIMPEPIQWKSREIVMQCNPKHVVPMHYRSDNDGFGYEVLAMVDDFAGIMDDVEKTGVSQLDTENMPEAQALVMVPLNVM